jgi:hypothetical protein
MKLRYDYPLLSYSGSDEVTELPYDQAWAPERKDVVIALPNGSRFVFWRGAAYTPFWAGKHNTALNFEFAEAPRRPDGLDCIDAASDKELRRSRVEIIESTAARVHVRWTTQPCDLNYKVWGESVTEDFYFYPDASARAPSRCKANPRPNTRSRSFSSSRRPPPIRSACCRRTYWMFSFAMARSAS